MLPITSYMNQVMTQLEFHFLRVEKESELIQDPSYYILQKEAANFIEAVIFFIHFILTTPELHSEFKFLLNKTEEKRSAYIEINQSKIKAALQTIGNYFLNNSQYANKIQVLDTDRWAFTHPLYDSPMNIKDFLLFCVKCQEIDKWNNKILSRVLGNISGNSYGIAGLKGENICPQENWATFPLNDAISKFIETVNDLENIEVFEYSFTGCKAAGFLNDIYSVCTVRFRKSIIPSNETTRIRYSINKKLDVQECVRSCNIIYNYLKHKMSLHLSKQAVIKRFVTYMELYFPNEQIPEGEKSAEKYFQREFERFSFLHGIYPVSEAQLSNARIDNLLTTPDQSFLCELKQVGFGAEIQSQKSILEKLKHAITQSNIYHKRLESYPSLLLDVYIIIVTRVPFTLDREQISHNKINYYFNIINLSDTAPSKQRPINISTNEIFG